MGKINQFKDTGSVDLCWNFEEPQYSSESVDQSVFQLEDITTPESYGGTSRKKKSSKGKAGKKGKKAAKWQSTK